MKVEKASARCKQGEHVRLQKYKYTESDFLENYSVGHIWKCEDCGTIMVSAFEVVMSIDTARLLIEVDKIIKEKEEIE